MLSYQHAYHAGNHADVIKHIGLMLVLQKLNQKPAGYFYLDTHAGEGIYHLNQHDISKPSEHLDGSTKLLDKTINSPVLKDYVAQVKEYSKYKTYPGSPMIAANLLRAIDHSHAAELHPNVHKKLKINVRGSGMTTHPRDGFEAMKALLPPKLKRGVVLIDPPYEEANEYQRVVDSLALSLKKWAQGIFIVWYPLLSPTRINRSSSLIEDTPKAGQSRQMLSQIAKLPCKNVLLAEFCPFNASENIGMYGSGLCIVNAPWQVDTQLQSVLNELSMLFNVDPANQVKWLKEETQ